jgi:replication initiator protein RepSA
MTDTSTRAERMATPLARDSIRKIAEASGGCLRPIQMRRTDTVTGQVEQVMKPCGATLASICPPCAERAKMLRIAQCREGWHLEDEPDPGPPGPDRTQEYWLTLRAEAQVRRDRAEASGEDLTVYDALIAELDFEITKAGVRGTVTSHSNGSQDEKPKGRRVRSTRRRQDAPDLPKRKITPQTIGRVFTAPDGMSYRPSMFLTLTCDSYGKVNDDGTPADPGTYDYTRAARDALHFSALVDRFIQNLRRVLGYDAQYFGAVEPQKRLAPHLHMAIRGAVPRAVVRQVIAATYHQVWWPSTDTVRFDGDQLPVWDEDLGTYLDPATGEVLPTWDQALDAIGSHDDPLHVARFGPEFHAEGVLAGSRDAARCIGYMTKYITKHVADCHAPETDAQRAHADRLADVLRFEPCSPTCANWLRYGIQPKNAKAGLVPGRCKGKAHRPEHVGYAGRRVLTSRKWSGKTLADHRGDRKTWLIETLGLEVPDPARYTWCVVTPSDHDYLSPDKRLLHVVADRNRWRAVLDEARRRARDRGENLSATETEAA